MEILKLLSASEIVAQILSFLLLFFFLRVFLWKRILNLLDERRKKVSSEFQKIEDLQKEAGNLKSEYTTKLNSIEEIAKTKIQEAIDGGRKTADLIIKEADTDAQEIIQSAKADIKYEITKAREELKGQIIDLALKAAEEVIGEKLTPEGDRKLVEGFLKEMDKAG